MRRLHLMIVGLVLVSGIQGEKICKAEKEFCQDGNCQTEQVCINGNCQPDGGCHCLPCYKGHTCDEFVDEHFAFFLRKQESIFIEPTHTGMIYKVKATDMDLQETCLSDPEEECPCADIFYEILEGRDGRSTPFFVDRSSGEVFVQEGGFLSDGQKFQLNVSAANFHDKVKKEPSMFSFDILTLNIEVRDSNNLENMLINAELTDKEDELSKYQAEMNNKDFHSKNKRIKRAAFGEDIANNNLTLEIVTDNVLEPLQPGQSIDFKLTIILPEVDSGTPMDLLVELYVMDTISGITTFALCNVEVTKIGGAGSKIKKETDGSTLVIDDVVISNLINEEFETFYDRALLDFGSLYNEDAYSSGSTSYDDSTIEITFTAILVSNDNYTNDTAIVTAGAEYDDEKYVWVSQASFEYDHTTSAYPADFDMKGPSPLAEGTAGQFDVEAFVSSPFDEFEFEVFSPSHIHDAFSVTSVTIASKGENHACILPGLEEYFTQKSVSGETNHRMGFRFPILVKNLDYANSLADEESDVGNLILISFTIKVHNAVAGEDISIGAGATVGSTILWTGFANITLDAALAAATGPPTAITVINLDDRTASPVVGPGQSATYAVQLELQEPGTVTEIDCKATPGSTNKVCGVGYGISSKYAASFPDLLEHVDYNDDGSAEWKVNIDNGFTDPADQDARTTAYVTFEVTLILNDAAAGGSIVCNGLPETFTATTGTDGIADLSGVVTQMGNDDMWYGGSQAAIMATLTFPANGVAYTQMIMETSGDFFETSFGTRVCAVDLVKVGRGATCVSRIGSQIQDYTVYKQALSTSPLNDSVEIDFGEMCGSYISDAGGEDYSFSIRVTYEVPLGQDGLTDTSYNLSIGAMMDSTLIWTGWSAFSFEAAPLTTLDETKLPILTIEEIVDDQEEFRPFAIKMFIKAHPGSVGRYIVKATSDDVSIIEICRIVILNLGFNYACIDTEPYGKHLDPAQSVLVTHDSADWAQEATLDMGTVRNLGTGDVYGSKIADEDTIEIAVIAKGVLPGAGSITLNYDDARSTPITDTVMPVTIVEHNPTTTAAVIMNVTGLDLTMEYYTDMTKQLNVDLHIPPGYDKLGHIEVVNADLTQMTICFAAVAWAGLNVPCVIPSKILPERLVGAGGEDIVKLDFTAICYIDLSDNLTESVINIRVGVMPNADAASATFDVIYYEDAGTTLALTETVTVTKSASDYVAPVVNLSGISLSPVDTAAVTTVEPGDRMWLGIYLSLPPSVTLLAELGVMTKSENGHSHATVHGFRYGETQGKNIACIEEADMYETTLIQNASTDGIPMIHESQTDTLVVPLKYITNTGISYLQMLPTPEDDMAMIEADIWVADHEALATGDFVAVTFSLKLDTVIVILQLNLTISKPATNDQIVLSTEFFFTTLSADPPPTFYTGDKFELTGRMQHDKNESHVEAYGASIRLLLPSYIKHANSSHAALVGSATEDTSSINITSDFVNTDILQFEISHLFFTDVIEFSITLSVDPYNDMPKGLGLLNSTALMRLVGRKSAMTATASYLGSTKYVNYVVEGTECYEDLLVSSFDESQFLGSTAIDATVGAEMSVTATGWSPAVRDSTVWDHHISIDFLQKARITKITFAAVAGKRTVTSYKLLISYDGIIFSLACPNVITPGNLPDECKVETRFARVLIVGTDDPDEERAIGVNFSWFGCYFPNSVLEETVFGETPLTTELNMWRHADMDTSHDIIYFCDYNPKKKRMECYSSADGTDWNVLPSYIGSLAGYDAGTEMMYAWDTKKRSMVASEDGVQWGLVDSAVSASLTLTTPTPIPGEEKGTFTSVTIGSWTADFDGLMSGGDYKVKWNSCCA